MYAIINKNNNAIIARDFNSRPVALNYMKTLNNQSLFRIINQSTMEFAMIESINRKRLNNKR